MSDKRKVARWIYEDCDEAVSEIEWLLDQVESHWAKQDKSIYTEYDGVFSYLKEKQESEVN